MNRKVSELEVDLNEAVVFILESGINRTQAEYLLGFFPDLDQARPIADYFIERRRDFSDFESYIGSVLDAMKRQPGLYEQEVRERTAQIPRERLFWTHYRDTPWTDSHLHEHLAGQERNKPLVFS